VTDTDLIREAEERATFLRSFSRAQAGSIGPYQLAITAAMLLALGAALREAREEAQCMNEAQFKANVKVSALRAELGEAREALLKGADTFSYLSRALRRLDRNTLAEACDIAEQGTRAAALSAGEGMEFAWLIERGPAVNHAPTVWWAGAGVDADYGEWTLDPWKARRFKSKDDAQETLITRISAYRHNPLGTVVQHGFARAALAAGEDVASDTTVARDGSPIPEVLLDPKLREPFMAMVNEMSNAVNPNPLYPVNACECGYPEKPCLRIMLRNGPPFPARPCEPLAGEDAKP
jgi:hypothetical protein